MHGGLCVLSALEAVFSECMGDVLCACTVCAWGAVLSAWLGFLNSWGTELSAWAAVQGAW